MNNRVTVIVTCYNHGMYVEQCLRSIFSQTIQEIDLLVINDGSTDDSDNIITSVLSESPFHETHYIKQENSGICVTRNLGLDWMQGQKNRNEFLLFVDSDNYLNSDYLERLMDTAISQEADIVYGNLRDSETDEYVVIAHDYDLDSLMIGNYIDNCSLIRQNIIGSVRYDVVLNRKKLEDYDFILRLIINQDAKPFYCPQADLNYRVLGNSISKHDDKRYYYEVYLYVLGKYWSTLQDAVKNAMLENFDIMIQQNDMLNHQNDILNNQNDILNNQNQGLKDSNLKFEKRIIDLEYEKTSILNSKSYRIGNLLIKTGKYLTRPSLFKPYISRKILALKLKIKSWPTLKGLFLKPIRNQGRKVNNYLNPKRLLIYVIYENQSQLQTYKLIFLASLAKLSDEALIVVNGDLSSEDIRKLSQFGQVECRDNSGYDTAAFKYGIEWLGQEKISQFDELLLVNDTNVGPVSDLQDVFEKMTEKRLDFWGISYGEPQPDFTGFNPYQTIPVHLQSYFLVIERSLLKQASFWNYWRNLTDTDSRNKAIGKHETVFTKYFEDLGFKHGAVSDNIHDSAMYIHPLTMIQDYDVPIVKYTAFANDSDDKFAWQGLKRETEIPALLTYIKEETDYPMSVIDGIMSDIKQKHVTPHILIIDGVENAIPQCTRYRVTNKAEQLRSFGQDVWVVNHSAFKLGYAEQASKIIIYRCGYSEQLAELIHLAKKYHKPIYYDVDDLVIDTKYTDQLSYTQNLSPMEKLGYDAGVKSYRDLLALCDGAITTTQILKLELQNYQSNVLLNRNLASQQLVAISNKSAKDYSIETETVKIAYFSGSITHNENFELIKPAVIQILQKYPFVELHLVGHIDIPKELSAFKNQLVFHDFVDWQVLPSMIAEIDINLAPLVDSVFNRAKSEIKWIEAALVKVPTLASQIGAFSEMIQDGETGILVSDVLWFEKLEELVKSRACRQEIGEKAYDFVMKNCVTDAHQDELIDWVLNSD